MPKNKRWKKRTHIGALNDFDSSDRWKRATRLLTERQDSVLRELKDTHVIEFVRWTAWKPIRFGKTQPGPNRLMTLESLLLHGLRIWPPAYSPPSRRTRMRMKTTRGNPFGCGHSFGWTAQQRLFSLRDRKTIGGTGYSHSHHWLRKQEGSPRRCRSGGGHSAHDSQDRPSAREHNPKGQLGLGHRFRDRD